MGRLVDVDDLVSATEVAEVLGLSHHNSVTTYYRRYADFPRPVVDKSNGRIRLWDEHDVRRWARTRSAGSPVTPPT
jgi:predicted DNA-binding transcriptional regulator AlpA